MLQFVARRYNNTSQVSLWELVPHAYNSTSQVSNELYGPLHYDPRFYRRVQEYACGSLSLSVHVVNQIFVAWGGRGMIIKLLGLLLNL